MDFFLRKFLLFSKLTENVVKTKLVKQQQQNTLTTYMLTLPKEIDLPAKPKTSSALPCLSCLDIL